ncbi:MAG: trypsin-like serine protease, partial [Pseudomonadota bacterium]|nr:trypsin-like serine protease [Pseudomonadota bacterium]
PRYVLTAAHVVGGVAPAAVRVQVNATATAVVIRVKAIALFPGASFPYDDLAVLELTEPVSSSVRIMPIYRSVPAPGQVITIVGYGASARGDSAPFAQFVEPSAAVKRHGRNVLDAVQASIDGSGKKSLFYRFDFDGPTGFGALGGPSLGNAIETGLAAGDSGSPVFADIDGKTWLLGINNHVTRRAGVPATDYRFGTQAGGMLLSDPRFIAWLAEQTQRTLAVPSAGSSAAQAGEHR